jgi:Protein of unknown function (DUF3179)
MRSKSAALVVVLLAAAGCGSHHSAHSRARPLAASAPSNQVAALEAGWRTNFRRHTVPLTQFQSGGPGKDGIPALDRSRFLHGAGVSFLRPREPVIELVIRGQARAYPLQILVWHEIVNDTVGGIPVAVTFCPLCNTAIAFDRRVGGRTLTFGTTGDLRNSDLVMYDRQTQSWWQQFGGEGVVGDYAGTNLSVLPARIVSWHAFRTAHPGGLVLSRATGYSRPYGQNPYVGYDDVSTPPYFPAANSDGHRLAPKERVVFVEHGRNAIAVPFTVLAQKKRIATTLGGLPLDIRWQGGVNSPLDAAQVAAGRDVGTAQVLAAGRPVPFSEPFWFAVAAFRPHVRIVH